jgi:hypothetical protein
MSSTTNSSKAASRLIMMLHLQHDINSKINPAWVQAGNPWYRAIWTECAEMMDHVGWKWWKKIEPNVEQIHLELIDIFHFGLSELIVANGTVDAACDAAQAHYEAIEGAQHIGALEGTYVLKLIEEFASKTLTAQAFASDLFAELCMAVGLCGDDLFRKYVGKNVLNTFRQDHGYKNGSYVKIWNAREDNEWLAEIDSKLNTSSEKFQTELYQALKEVYRIQGGTQTK